jgi:streptogramin lyase
MEFSAPGPALKDASGKVDGMTRISSSSRHRASAMLRRPRRCLEIGFCSLLLGLAVGCGGDDPTGPVPGTDATLVALNSTGQTLASFRVEGNEILPAAVPVDLGAGFDGDGVALYGSLAASTVSSFGGSRIVLVDLSEGSVSEAVFPGPDPALVNPSRAEFDAEGVLWMGGRGSDAVYRLSPGAGTATRVATGVGTFVERVVPVGEQLFVIDANIDDDGGTYAPLGAGRVVVLDRDGTSVGVIELPADATNPSDGLLAESRLIILAGGTFDPVTFAPNADGSLVTVDPVARRVTSNLRLGANGVRLALGADGYVYVTTTVDYVTLALLRFDPRTGRFDRGPDQPIDTRGPSGDPVPCWTAAALADSRILCSTFRTDAPGRMLLMGPDGDPIFETESGFGTTEIAIRE